MGRIGSKVASLSSEKLLRITASNLCAKENEENRHAPIFQLQASPRSYILLMTKQNKLLDKFLSKSRNFTFDEMKKLLSGFGYQEIRTEKTSRYIIRLHKPHPRRNLKKYQLDLVEEELKKWELIK